MRIWHLRFRDNKGCTKVGEEITNHYGHKLGLGLLRWKTARSTEARNFSGEDEFELHNSTATNSPMSVLSVDLSIQNVDLIFDLRISWYLHGESLRALEHFKF